MESLPNWNTIVLGIVKSWTDWLTGSAISRSKAINTSGENTGTQNIPNDSADASEALRAGRPVAPSTVSNDQLRTNIGFLPDEQEIQRRRSVVREFFADFWNGTSDKPTTFAERLNAAEGYINERLADRGEEWRLDAATRKQLGLPASSSGLVTRAAMRNG
jgi:hypothetical protein